MKRRDHVIKALFSTNPRISFGSDQEQFVYTMSCAIFTFYQIVFSYLSSLVSDLDVKTQILQASVTLDSFEQVILDTKTDLKHGFLTGAETLAIKAGASVVVALVYLASSFLIAEVLGDIYPEPKFYLLLGLCGFL